MLDVAEGATGVRVSTERGIYEGQILVGADGSGSRVRQTVFGARKETIGRALMTDIAVDPERTPEFTGKRYRFDFRCVSGGINGYSWSFPCLIGGRPHLNVGIYDQRPREFAEKSGRTIANDSGTRRGVSRTSTRRPEAARDAMAFVPDSMVRRRDSYASGRVILAGDAAGVDPLMGEGISCAFEHGKLAANAICKYLEGDGGALQAYDRALHEGAVGKKLGQLAFAARHFYGPHHRLFFRLARISRRAQEIGVDWYNGARHLDEVPTRRLIARWARAVLLGEPVR